jgi:hypothetical protein
MVRASLLLMNLCRKRGSSGAASAAGARSLTPYAGKDPDRCVVRCSVSEPDP